MDWRDLESIPKHERSIKTSTKLVESTYWRSLSRQGRLVPMSERVDPTVRSLERETDRSHLSDCSAERHSPSRKILLSAQPWIVDIESFSLSRIYLDVRRASVHFARPRRKNKPRVYSSCTSIWCCMYSARQRRWHVEVNSLFFFFLFLFGVLRRRRKLLIDRTAKVSCDLCFDDK